MRLSAAVIVSVLALTACGSDGNEPPPTGATATSEAPAATNERPPSGTVTGEVAPGSGSAAEVRRPAKPLPCPSVKHGAKASRFDAREILGLTTAKAEALAGKNKCTIRIVVEDGQEFPQTMDLRYERINVVVEQGTVVELRGIG